MSSEYVLQMQNICKSFPGVKALEHVDLNLRVGSVHALLGENGAGKSTLMKILAGIYTADSGEILIQGQSVRIHSVDDAKRAGIVMIHQELSGAANLTVTENIYLNEELKGTLGFIDRKAMRRNVEQFLEKYNLHISPDEKYGNLSVAQMQMVEIMKTIAKNAKVIIMDEPTSALTLQETQTLIERIHELKARGISVLYISHKLEEIEQICDEVTVLRDGKFVATKAVKHLDRSEMISMMVGRSITNVFPQPEEKTIGDVALELRELTDGKRFFDINLSVRYGEIVGISGLMGAGRSELFRAVVGLDRMQGGQILLDGKLVAIHCAADAIRNKIVMVPEDRKKTGFVPRRSIVENISLPHLPRFRKPVFIDKKAEKACAMEYYRAFNIKASGPEQQVVSLSGGNQQKVILAKWLMGEPKVIILDEPTRGIDVGAKYEIYQMIHHLAAQGLAVVMISSELPEILGMSDRILVMHEGRLTGELNRQEATQEKIMTLATGGELT